jgi:cell division septal protein FtsQ
MKLLRNQRLSSGKQRRQQHLLDVKVRSRKAAEQRNRKIIQSLCVLLLAASAVFGFYKGVRKALAHFFWENRNYQLREIEVISDGALTRAEILERTQIREGGNIFTINLSAAREQLVAMAQVERAELQRVLPGKISIRVTERRPIAWLVDKKDVDPSVTPGAFLLDRKAVAMQLKNLRPEYLRLPVIYGIATADFVPGQQIQSPQVLAAVELIRLMSEGRSEFQARTVDLSRPYCIVTSDADQRTVTFALTHIEKQLERLNLLLKEVAALEGELRSVNLMVERNLPVNFVPLSDRETADDQSTSATIAAKDQAPKQKKKPAAKKAKPFPDKMPVRRAIPVKPARFPQLNG